MGRLVMRKYILLSCKKQCSKICFYFYVSPKINFVLQVI